MSVGVFKLKDTGDREWYVVVANGITSRPLRRDLAGGLAQKFKDDELLKAFQDAQERWNSIAEKYSAMLAEMLVSEKLQAEEVTSRFHADAYPKVFLLGGCGPDYVVVPEDGVPVLVVGLAVAETTVQKLLRLAEASQDAGPSGLRR